MKGAPVGTGIRKEHALLWAAALQVGSSDKAEIRTEIRTLADQNIDWGCVVQSATSLGGLSLLSTALSRAGVAPPSEVEAAFRAERLRASIKSLVAESFLADLLPAFDSRGIPCMVLKGLPLAMELYSDPLLRSFDDVDLIVPPRHRDAALAVVSGLGFALPRGSFSPDFYRRHHFHVGLVRERQHEVALELHWDFQPRFSLSRVPEADAWRQVRTVRVGRLSVPVLDREVNFLYLIQHLARHLVVLDSRTLEDPVGALLEPGRHGRLTWFTDLMLSGGGDHPLDRDRVERMAHEWGLERELGWMLTLLRTAAPQSGGAAGSRPSAPTAAMRPGAFTRLTRRLPWTAGFSQRLQFRPALMFGLVPIAFPGGAWIRNRYDLKGASKPKVAVQSIGHALGMLLAAARLAGATLWELLRSEGSSAPTSTLAIVLVALAAALRFPGLGRASLWWDECHSLEMALSVARAPIATVVRALAGGLSPYFVVLAPWVRPDTSEWMLRLPSVLAGIALVLVACRLGQEIGGRRLAWRLGMAAAVSPFFVWHAREARFYPFAWSLDGLAAIFFLRALKTMTVRALLLWLAFGFLAAAVYTPSLTLMVVEGGWLLAARRRGERRGFSHAWVASSAGALLIGAVAVWMAQTLVLPLVRGGSAGFGFQNLGGVRPLAALYTPIAFVTGYSIGPGPLEWHQGAHLRVRPFEAAVLLIAVIGFLSLVVAGVRHLVRCGEARLATTLVTLGALPPIAILIACAWSGHRYAPRHAGLACLFWLTLAAAGTIPDDRWGRMARAVALPLLAIEALALWNLYASPRYLREEVGPAALYVASIAGPDDLILVFGGIDLPWKHYYRGAAPSRIVYADDPATWSPATIQALAAGRHRMIEVTGEILGTDAEAPLHAALRGVSSVMEKRAFHAVDVVRWEVLPVKGP